MVQSRQRSPLPLFFLFYFSFFFLLLTSRSDGFKLPLPPLSSPTFRFTSPSSDLSLYGGDLLEALGDSSLQRTLYLLSARFCLSSGCRDLLQLWMFSGHQVWGSIPVRVSIAYPNFGVVLAKLFFLKSPYHT